MCSFAAASFAISAVSAISQYRSAKSQAQSIDYTAQSNRSAAEYNAQVQENNAIVQDRAAQDARARGAESAATKREIARKANATGRARSASSGLLVDEGNYGDIQDQNVVTGELDALTTMNNAEREAYGYNVNASNARTQAKNIRYQADLGLNNASYQSSVVQQNGLLTAGTTVLSGAVNYGKSAFPPTPTYTPYQNDPTLPWRNV